MPEQSEHVESRNDVQPPQQAESRNDVQPSQQVEGVGDAEFADEPGLGPSWAEATGKTDPDSSALSDALEMPDWDVRPDSDGGADDLDVDEDSDSVEVEPVEEPIRQQAGSAELDVPQPATTSQPPSSQDVPLDPDLLPGGIFDTPASAASSASSFMEAIAQEEAASPAEDLDAVEQGGDAVAPWSKAVAEPAEPEPPAEAAEANDAAELAEPEETKEQTPTRSRPASGNAEELRYERLQLRVVDDAVERLLLATELIEVIGMPPVRCEVNLCPPGTQLESLKVHFNPKPWSPEDADVVWGLVNQWLPRVWATLCNRERADESVVETWVSYKDPALPGEQHLRIATTLGEDIDFATFGRAHRNAIEERTDGKWFDPVVVPEA